MHVLSATSTVKSHNLDNSNNKNVSIVHYLLFSKIYLSVCLSISGYFQEDIFYFSVNDRKSFLPSKFDVPDRSLSLASLALYTSFSIIFGKLFTISDKFSTSCLIKETLFVNPLKFVDVLFLDLSSF